MWALKSVEEKQQNNKLLSYDSEAFEEIQDWWRFNKYQTWNNFKNMYEQFLQNIGRKSPNIQQALVQDLMSR